eukprot:2080937-Amphidinium_carterae.1
MGRGGLRAWTLWTKVGFGKSGVWKLPISENCKGIVLIVMLMRGRKLSASRVLMRPFLWARVSKRSS